MYSPRWHKLWGDVRAERGRMALMVLSVLVSLAALGAVLGAWAVLSREIVRSYASTHPAHATLELPNGVDAATLALVGRSPLVAEAEAREVVLARAHVGDNWRSLLLFGVPDFEGMQMNRFASQSGAWPPPLGTILLERSALAMAQASQGDWLEVKTPHGRPARVKVAGVVHDAGLAPAWQERAVYGYATLATLATLEGQAAPHELRVRFRHEPVDAAHADRMGQQLAAWLRAEGVDVHELRVPPPREHPHQRQMVTVLLLLVSFGVLSLLLSSVVVATSLSALMTRQVREIGVMKALGARSSQLRALYAALVMSLGGLAALLAAPLGLMAARAWARVISEMLNFELVSRSVPAWVFVLQVVAGVCFPLLTARGVIQSATNVSVRAALDAYEAPAKPVLAWLRLPRVWRNLLRRPKRLAFTLLLLATGGGLFIAALSLAGAWEANLAKMQATRHYDVEVRLHEPPPTGLGLEGVPDVRKVEWWGYAPAAFAVAGRIDTVRTYPDRAHGSLILLAPPPETRLISFPLLAGRWLQPGDDDGVVLNHVAAAQRAGVRVGDQLTVSAEGVTARVRVVGIVEEVGAAGVVYMSRRAFQGRFGAPRLARLTTASNSASERNLAITTIEQELAHAGASVQVVMSFAELRTAVGDHVVVLVNALVALAAVLGCVGLLGLSSSMTTAVVERTREIGVMKAMGAVRRRILRDILAEGVLTAGLSAMLAVLLALPLAALVEAHLGRLGFLAPLPFVVSVSGAALWTALVLVASLLATWLPARRAAGISVREAIAHV
jgi:putative ABC transport system permease protein